MHISKQLILISASILLCAGTVALVRQSNTQNSIDHLTTILGNCVQPSCLYTPWRGAYIEEKHREAKKNKHTKCPFCTHYTSPEHDADNYILKRYQHCIVMLNLLPYTTGSLLIIPADHVSTLHELSEKAAQEIMRVMRTSEYIMLDTLGADGVNIGINIGKAGGASLPDHLHVQIVPRWYGDANFLTVVAKTTVVHKPLSAVYEQLKPVFDQAAL